MEARAMEIAKRFLTEQEGDDLSYVSLETIHNIQQSHEEDVREFYLREMATYKKISSQDRADCRRALEILQMKADLTMKVIEKAASENFWGATFCS